MLGNFKNICCVIYNNVIVYFLVLMSNSLVFFILIRDYKLNNKKILIFLIFLFKYISDNVHIPIHIMILEWAK